MAYNVKYKFSQEDKVVFMHENKIESGIVKYVEIRISNGYVDKIYHIKMHGGPSHSLKIQEPLVFSNKKELLKSFSNESKVD